ncbi:MAG: glycerate kinase type-2 family protein [Roseinatronobacter sp.]
MLDRDEMVALFRVGVAAADPKSAVAAHLRAAPLLSARRLLVLGFGKAACAMTEAALEALPQTAEALIITNPENLQPVAGARVLQAGHPVPDAQGLAAAQAVMAMLARAQDGDHLLVLVSGGGSAMLPAPVDGVSLADKADLSRLLLGAGLDITEINAVRQHLSRLKGGGLLQMAAPARVTSLILSDVIGNDLRVIASGPTVAPLCQRAEAVALLQARDLWEQLPGSVRAALQRPETPLQAPPAQNLLIGSNALSVAAMARACPQAHYVSQPLTGDVGSAAEAVCMLAMTSPGVTLMGGETTVRLSGQGRGGRNQELALRVALALDGRPGWRFLSAGTDGRDGPTEAAGAVVDGKTCARIRAAGGDPQALLADNDSFTALGLSGDLLITGGTGTNVADLQILSVAQ